MSVINTKWLCVITIFEVEEKIREQNEELSLQNITLKQDSNTWIGSLQSPKYNSANLQVVIFIKRWDCQKQSYVNTLYEKKHEKFGFEKSRDTILNKTKILVDTAETTEFFVFLNSRYNAENRILITLGHGGVFGMNYIDDSFVKKLADEIKMDKNLIQPFKDAKLFVEKENEKTIDCLSKASDEVEVEVEIKNKVTLSLSTRELAESFKAFTKPEGKKPIDILVSANCFMQNVFAQYDYHTYVDYYVAPMSGISYPGYNFLDIFNEIENYPNISVELVAKKFVATEYIEEHNVYTRDVARYTNEELEKDYKLRVKKILTEFTKKAIDERWFIQCMKLDSTIYNEFGKLFKEFINLLTNLCEADRDMILIVKGVLKLNYNYAKKSLPDLTLVDLRTFTFNLVAKIKSYYKNKLTQDMNCLFDVEKKLEDIYQKIDLKYYIGKHFLVDGILYLDKYFTGENLNVLPEKLGFGFYLTTDLIPNGILENLLHKNSLEQPQLTEGTQYLKLLQLLR